MAVSDKIGLAGWSFSVLLKAGVWDIERYISHAGAMGIGNIEVNNVFFASTAPEYLQKLKEKARAEGVAIINIAVDDHDHSLSDTDGAKRAVALQRAAAWLDAAGYMGIPFVRFNTGGGDYGACVKSFSQLAGIAAEKGITVLIENHGGLSSDIGSMVKLIGETDKKYPGCVKSLPDTGNVISGRGGKFPLLETFARHAGLVHLKIKEDLDDDKYLAGCLEAIRKSGYEGVYLVEYEGEGEGVRETADIVARLEKLMI